MSCKILKYFEFRQGEILLGMSVISSLLEYCRMTTQNLMEKLKHSCSYADILQRSINLKEWKFKAQLEFIWNTYMPIWAIILMIYVDINRNNYFLTYQNYMVFFGIPLKPLFLRKNQL